MALSPQLFKFGNATILVENGDFADGYYNGLTGGFDLEQPVSVEAIRAMIVESLSDLQETPTWNTGYIAGALTDLYKGSHRRDEPDAPQVQLGPVTLRLNRWRFHDGYYIGHEEYEAAQQERPTPGVVTARELLDTIAHCDSGTDTYHFGQEELSALEDILGQLVGYLCAALFSQTNEEPNTGPLQVTALQEV